MSFYIYTEKNLQMQPTCKGTKVQSQGRSMDPDKLRSDAWSTAHTAALSPGKVHLQLHGTSAGKLRGLK